MYSGLVSFFHICDTEILHEYALSYNALLFRDTFCNVHYNDRHRIHIFLCCISENIQRFANARVANGLLSRTMFFSRRDYILELCIASLFRTMHGLIVVFHLRSNKNYDEIFILMGQKR